MFVQTVDTPNENALKFVPGNIPISDTPIDFPNLEKAAEVSDLATRLFKIENVKRVFFGSNFITITKEESTNWTELKPHIFMTIVEYMTNGWPIFKHEDKADSEYKIATKSSENKVHNFPSPDLTNPVIKEIIALIEERVRPAVAMDGGDINFVNFVDGVVYVEMTGACNGCSSADMTLKNGIETMLKHYIPEVKSVEKV